MTNNCFECNGQCSRCGECCTPMLPLTLDEIKTIKEYIKEHNIKMENPVRGNNVYVRCPFYNIDEKKCNIYEVRPEVCKAYRCSYNKRKTLKNIKYFDSRADVNGNHLDRFVPLDLLFYNSPIMTLLIMDKQLHISDEALMRHRLFQFGGDIEFFADTGLPSTHDILVGLSDGSIKIDWEEN